VTTYIYDAQGDLAEELGGPTNPYAGQTTYLTSDHLGSTRAVTSVTGSPLARYDYAPFGEDLNTGMDGRTAPFLNNFYPVQTSDGTDAKFTSKERDAETGLDFFEARHFSFTQGRFVSPDGPFNDQDPSNPQSWNLYSYIRNNPVNGTDPTGEECVDTNSCTITVNGGAGPPVGYDPSLLRVQFGILNAVTQTVQTAAKIGQTAASFIQRTNWNCVSSATVAGASVGFEGGAAVGLAGGPFSEVTVPAGAAIGSIATGTTALAGSLAFCSTGSGGGTGRSGGEGSGGKNGWTNKIAREKAEGLGFKEAKGGPFNSRNQLTFKSGNRWITPDIDGHTGYQTWKVFDSSGNRLGTYNTDLTMQLGK
jgi:RHS repeat-associated protein